MLGCVLALGLLRGSEEATDIFVSLSGLRKHMHVHCEYSLNWTLIDSFYMDVRLTSF